MTRVLYCPHCSHIEEIADADINGAAHMDTPDADRVRACLAADGLTRPEETVEPELWEPVLALITMEAYEGELSMYDLAATPFAPVAQGPCPHCEEVSLAQTLLTVSVVDEQMMLVFDCEECGFAPEQVNDWNYDVEEYDDRQAHNYVCPDCDSVVWTDWFDIPDEEFDTYDYDGYGEFLQEESE